MISPIDVPARARFPGSLVIGYIAGGALLWLFLRNAEWQVLRGGFQTVGWLLLGAAVILRLLALVVSSLRWQALLAPAQRVPLGPILAAMMTGMAFSAFVSMQGAEIVRPYMLSKRRGLTFSIAFATVAIEWFLDLLAVLALFVPALWWMRGPGIGSGDADSSNLDRTIAVLLLLSVAGLAGLRYVPGHMARLGRGLHKAGVLPERIRERVAEQRRLFQVGLRILERPGGLAAVAAYSLLTAFLTAVSSWLALRAFGLSLTFFSGFVVLGIVTVGGMIPTPGAIGGFHAVCQAGLTALFKVEPTLTVLPVIGLHAVLYAPPAALGVLCVLRARWHPQGDER